MKIVVIEGRRGGDEENVKLVMKKKLGNEENELGKVKIDVEENKEED